MGNDFTTAMAAYAGATNGPVAMSWTLFATLFGLINDPMRAAVDGTIGSLTGTLIPLIRVATIAALIIGIIAAAISDNVPSSIPTGVIFKTLIRGAALIYLLGGAAVFTQWVTGPLLALPNDLSNVILNGTGATKVTQGGQLFDTLWIHTFAADIKAAQRASFWTAEGWVLGIIALLSALFSGLFIGYMFVKFLIAYMRLSIVAAIAPLAVASLVATQTRHWFGGWLNAAASCVLVIVLISVLLSVLIQAQQTQIDLVMNAPANANIMGMIGSAVGVAILCFVGANLTSEIPAIAVGITGGIYQQGAQMMKPIAAGAMSLGTTMVTMVTGGAAAPAAAAAMATSAPAGRSLSGRGP